MTVGRNRKGSWRRACGSQLLCQTPRLRWGNEKANRLCLLRGTLEIYENAHGQRRDKTYERDSRDRPSKPFSTLRLGANGGRHTSTRPALGDPLQLIA